MKFFVFKNKGSVSRPVVFNSCDPTDCSPPGSSVHEILQAVILEWIATPFSRGSSEPRERTQVSYITGRLFTIWATREAQHQEDQYLFGNRKGVREQKYQGR